MKVVDLLTSLAKMDIQLWLDGGNLRFNAPEGAFTAEIKQQVIANKAAIVEFLGQAKKLTDSPIPKVPRDDKPLPVSFGQQRLWVIDQITPNDVTYNMSTALRIDGALKVDILEKVLLTLVERHESLRTAFVEIDGEPMQVIQSANGWNLQVESIVDREESVQEAFIQAAVTNESTTPYDLGSGYLFRARLIALNDHQHVLVAGMHHIVSDAWSMEVLVKELGILYLAFSKGMPSPLPELPIQYPDYAVWQRQQMAEEGMAQHLEYWQQRLDGAPKVLGFPTDRPRQDLPTSNGAVINLGFSHQLNGRVAKACIQLDVTPFMLFLGGWQLLLGRYAHSHDVVIGSPNAGRSRQEVEELIGFFVNILLMRLDLSGNPSVKTFYGRVKEMVLGAFSHQDLPVDRLMEALNLERQPGYPPLAEIAFQLINLQEMGANNPLSSSGLSLTPIDTDQISARMDMVLAIAKTGDSFEASIEYNTDLFHHQTISLLLEQYASVMDQLLVSLDTPIDNIRLYGDQEIMLQLGVVANQHRLEPLNNSQKAIYAQWNDEQDYRVYQQQVFVDLPGRPDSTALNSALNQVLRDYPEASMEIFPCQLRGIDAAYAVIPFNPCAVWELVDSDNVNDFVGDPISLNGKTPLVRFYCLSQESGFRLVMVSHIIALDSYSQSRLLQCIVAQYQGHPNALSPEPNVFDTPAAIAHWQNTLNEVTPLSFSYSQAYKEFEKNLLSPFGDARISAVLDHRQVATINEYCVASNITQADYFRGLYAILLHKYCRPDNDFVLLESNHARPADHRAAVGCLRGFNATRFNQSLWAQSESESMASWFLSNSSSSGAQYYVSQQQKELACHHWPIQFMYSYKSVQALPTGEQCVAVLPKKENAVQLMVTAFADSIQLTLAYDPTVFNAHNFLARFVHLSEQMLFDEITSIHELRCLSAGETQQLAQWGTPSTEPVNSASSPWNLVDRFESIVKQMPDQVALVFGESTRTYAELNNGVNGLARDLTARGIGEGQRVVVCCSRSFEFIESVLACVKIGATYIPVDPAYPVARIRFMIEDSEATLILTSASSQNCLTEINTPVYLVDENANQRQSGANPELLLAPNRPLYAIYTSGSTGQPKGALVTQNSAVNLQRWYIDSLNLSPADATLLMSSVGFDLTQKNIFAPLLVGAKLVIPTTDLYDAEQYLGLIYSHKISWINCAPSAFYPLVEEGAEEGFSHLASVRMVVLGGEPIRLSAIDPWLSSSQCQGQLMNSYGPTECTDVVIYHKALSLEPYQNGLPIGVPIPNSVIQIVDDQFKQVIPGLAGEIVIGGIPVGLGYINREALTNEVFVNDPYTNQRFYRTGDLARFLPDGLIEYIGRKDFQVKLRGLRIELGEIEMALRAIDGVEDSLVTVHNDQLVAYVLSPIAPVAEQWRDSLRDFLPEHMIPNLIIAVDVWPLTPNGKIDRKALPDPEAQSTTSMPFVAPRNEVETQLVAIWQEVLGASSIGVLDDLFQIGGNSIVATRIVSRIRKHWDVPLSVRELFVAPTIADLAVAVKRAQQNKDLPPIQFIDRNGSLPLSFVQQQLWLLDQLDPGTAAYNMPVALRIKGKIDTDKFSQAFNLIIQRHETLRSNFRTINGEPQVFIQSERELILKVIDLSNLAADEKAKAVEKIAHEQTSQGFDLATDPLIRGVLVNLEDDLAKGETLLLGAMHHMVSDGWSMDLILAELLEIYNALCHGRKPHLVPLPIQYVDIAAWQRQWLAGSVLESHLAYWREQLDNEGQVLQLPTDYSRPPVLTSHGAVYNSQINANLVIQAQQFARQEGATLFMLLMACYQHLLSRYSGQDRINVGTPIAGRDQIESEHLIGFFINTVVISTQFESQLTVRGLLRKVRETTFDAYAHQALPFEKIVEALRPPRDSSRTPFFQVSLNLLNLPPQQNVDSDLIFESFVPEEHEIHSKYEMNLYVTEQADHSLSLVMVYNSDLFSAATIERFMADFGGLFEQFIAQPDQPLDLLRLGQPQDRKLLPSPTAPLVHGSHISPFAKFLEHAELTPDARAIVFNDADMNYVELKNACDRVAHHLQSNQQIQAGDVVAIYAERSPDLIVAIFAVLKVGGVFTVLDSGYPVERLQGIVELAQPKCLLNATRHSEVEWAQTIPVSVVAKVLESSTFSGALESQHNPAANSYIAFTSGTTGKPKGIVGTFEPVAHFIEWYSGQYHFTGQDRFTLFSGLAHDPLLRDIFVPLALGAELYIPPADWIADPGNTVQWLQQHGISVMHMTPSMAQVLMNSTEQQCPSVRFVGLGGDKLTKAVIQGLEELLPEAQVANFYGTTETPQVMAVFDVPKITDSLPSILPLGQGIDQVQILVMNESGELCSIGEVGEIVIRTPYLSVGYWPPEEDSSLGHGFARNPHTQDPRDRIYYTGDIGRYNVAGLVEFFGRRDNQIKIRGYRIEPAEIEQALVRQSGIDSAVVILAKDLRQDDCIVAYIEPAKGLDSVDSMAIREILRREIPEYMVPALVIPIDKIPVTVNGKIDRRRLPDPADFWQQKQYVAPATDYEQAIAEIWQTVLKMESISIEDNFFDIGGHSLLAVQIVTRVKELYQVEFSMRRLMELATIKGMASYVENALWLQSSTAETTADDDEDLEEFEI